MLKAEYLVYLGMYINISFLLKGHRESFEIWSAIIRINTVDNSLMLKLDPGEK